jgi:hypothetical protein
VFGVCGLGGVGATLAGRGVNSFAVGFNENSFAFGFRVDFFTSGAGVVAADGA